MNQHIRLQAATTIVHEAIVLQMANGEPAKVNVSAADGDGALISLAGTISQCREVLGQMGLKLADAEQLISADSTKYANQMSDASIEAIG